MKKLLLLPALIALIGLGGCIKATEVVTLNKDGSGTVDFTYGMKEETLKQLKSMSEAGEEGSSGSMSMDSFEFDEAKVREKFEGLKDKGVTLKKVSSEKKDGWEYMTVVFDFKDLSALRDADTPLDEFSLSKNADGNYVFTTKGGGEEKEMTDEEKQQMQMMAAMFAGMKIDIRINTPGQVLETNATSRGADYAQWVYDIDKDPAAMTKMESAGMKLVFSGKGVTIPEIKAPAPEVPVEEVVVEEEVAVEVED